MKLSFRYRCELLLAYCCVATFGAWAAFEGPYALTPPPPGVYDMVARVGRWTAGGFFKTIDTSHAPNSMVMQVPSSSFLPNAIFFDNEAIADGTISFDCAAPDVPSGYVFWRKRPVGTNLWSYIPLDTDSTGQMRHFAFQILIGERFGFVLLSDGDAGGSPENFTLTVTNYVGPIPPPQLHMPQPGVILWQGESNLTYSLQAKADLRATNWTLVGTASSSTTNLAFTNSAAALQRFFRVAWP